MSIVTGIIVRLRPHVVANRRSSRTDLPNLPFALSQMPYMLNTDELNWGAKMGFFWAGLCGICALYTYFRVPEPRGRTYGPSSLSLALRRPRPSQNLSLTHSAPLGRRARRPLPQPHLGAQVCVDDGRPVRAVERRAGCRREGRQGREGAHRARCLSVSAEALAGDEGGRKEPGAKRRSVRGRSTAKRSRFVRSLNLVVHVTFRISQCSRSPSLGSPGSTLRARELFAVGKVQLEKVALEHVLVARRS